MAHVELKGVTKTFGNTEVIRDVELEINKGEFVVFVGPSGCGKSTLLRLISGLEKLSSGEIIIANKEVMDLPPSERGIAMVFQSYALYPHMSVYQNMAFSLDLQKMPKLEIKQRVEEAAKILQMEDLLERRPAALSGGQRQRIAIARALALNPKLIIADEAVSALDVSVQAQVLNLMMELQVDLGLSFLFISHDMAVVERVSHDVGVMYLGRLVEIGPRPSIFRNPQHPYTQDLLKAVPIADPDKRKSERDLNFKPLPSPIHDLNYRPEPSVYRKVAKNHYVLTTACGY